MLVLKNAAIINFNPLEVIPDQDIIIDEGLIIKIGPDEGKNISGAKILDLKNKFVSPGLVCSHNHFYSALSRGIIANIKASNDFIGILKHLWWKLDRALDKESLYYSGMIGALEAVKSGTTAVIDHNASPSFIKGSLSMLRDCFETVGLRGILCYEITCRNGVKEAEEGLNESCEFINSLKNPHGGHLPLVEASIGAHASFTLDDEILKRISEAVKATSRGIHIHAGEDKYDVSYTHHISDMDILERLEDYGIINDKSIFAHGVNLSSGDIDILNRYDSFLVHNPRSNMNNCIGYLENAGSVKNLALGTDGIGSDMLEEIKFGYFNNRDAGGKLSPNDFIAMLHAGNKILGRYFNAGFGSVKEGSVADLTVYDYSSPTPISADNLAGHMIFGMSSRDVDSVIVNGKVIYENRTFPFDVTAIYENARKAAQRLWNEFDKIRD